MWEVMSKILAHLTDDLRRPEYRGLTRLAGHCYVASEVAYHALGGKDKGWKPMFVRVNDEPHWFLQHENGFILDLTGEQFDTKIPYDQARGKGFLTKKPSKRAKILIERMIK